MRFAEGDTDFLQVLEAERTQLESLDLLAQGRTEAARDYAALYKSLPDASRARIACHIEPRRTGGYLLLPSCSVPRPFQGSTVCVHR